ncbi:hypothetical protein B0T10DRAFT_581453 [Thelonectria olida]|uniref:NmrA-like domain-containing protein n=1 Tax=Thelonectria olida TaxID=1576542 RepID=A0A9P8VVX7_9HYPO|nr:hypothetical protein B0T10DRAFT_581453 [Thelonectria olida]
MSTFQFYLIAGATGRQGGAVVNALLSHPTVKIQPNQVYAISRQPTGLGAKKLEEEYKGIHILSGDLSNSEAIFQQLDKGIVSKTGVFLAQAHGPTELSDAKTFIDAAVAHGVPYFVYSSVDRGGRELSDRDPSYCKTFSDKFLIEKHLKSICGPGETKMDYTIIRPTWFADNAWWGFPGQLCMTGWRENMKGKKMQVTVTKDIGRWAAESFIRPDALGVRNQALSIASDEVSFDEIDAIFVRQTGKGVPVTYGLLARFVIWMVNDLNTMFRFIGERSYGADLSWLKGHLEPTTFEQWVKDEVLREDKKAV